MLEAALAGPVVEVRVTEVKGSAPRGTGTWMLVGDTVFGTIGGGQLEYMAIDAARALLDGGTRRVLDVPLGPDIGQCCGGRVTLSLRRLDDAGKAALRAKVAQAEAARPQVRVFGAGHVGRALANALDLLPVAPLVIDTRADEVARVAGVPTVLTAIPEAEVVSAPAGTAFVVMTHDHALDFLIAGAALDRGDAAYVGMIGSATKRAAFSRWYRDRGGDAAALVCPIAPQAPADKRPEVIAAFAAVEILQTLLTGVSVDA